MNPRKKCITCKKPLISYQGCYLHPDTPCGGIVDTISIEARVEDDFLQEKFDKLYGKPEMDDYERVGILEEEDEILKEEIKKLHSVIDNPILKFILKLFRRI